MLNYVWFGLMVVAIVVGAINGKLPEVTKAAFEMAEVSVNIALGLIGIMALWLGILKIAEEPAPCRFQTRNRRVSKKQ